MYKELLNKLNLYYHLYRNEKTLYSNVIAFEGKNAKELFYFLEQNKEKFVELMKLFEEKPIYYNTVYIERDNLEDYLFDLVEIFDTKQHNVAVLDTNKLSLEQTEELLYKLLMRFGSNRVFLNQEKYVNPTELNYVHDLLEAQKTEFEKDKSKYNKIFKDVIILCSDKVGYINKDLLNMCFVTLLDL